MSEPFWYIHVLYRQGHGGTNPNPALNPGNPASSSNPSWPASGGMGAPGGQHGAPGGGGQYGGGVEKSGGGTSSCDFTWVRGRLFDPDVAQLLFEVRRGVDRRRL